MKKALVTGSAGNIGRPLVKHLKSLKYEVVEVDIRPRFCDNNYVVDITKPVDLLQAFDFKPDYVFHLAAMVSRVTCEQSGSMCIDTNLTGTQNVIELTKKCGAKLINFSTSEVYGPNLSLMDETVEPTPNNRYGISKLLAEKLVEYEVSQHGLNAVSLRPFMIYDEYEQLGDHRSAMIRFAHNLSLGNPIEVHNNSERSWMHISDAVRAIEASAHVKGYYAINIGSPDVQPIRKLAEMICDYYNADHSLIRHNNLPSRMTLKKNPSLKRQEELLGFVPQVSLNEGVKLVCSKMRERMSNI